MTCSVDVMVPSHLNNKLKGDGNLGQMAFLWMVVNKGKMGRNIQLVLCPISTWVWVSLLGNLVTNSTWGSHEYLSQHLIGFWSYEDVGCTTVDFEQSIEQMKLHMV